MLLTKVWQKERTLSSGPTKAEALVDSSEEVPVDQQFLQTKTLSWNDVEPELELWVPPARDEYECLLHEFGTAQRPTEPELSDLQDAGYVVEWAPSKMDEKGRDRPPQGESSYLR